MGEHGHEDIRTVTRRAGRRSLADPPSVADVAELARRLAVEAPETFPTFLWSVVRSSRVARACRRHEPTGAHLAAIHRVHPAGTALIESFRAGARRLRKWANTVAALDELLPPITDDEIPPLGD